MNLLKTILPLPALCALSLNASTILHVELYPSGAAVTREVQVAATDATTQTVELAELPTQLMANSVQIAAPGSDLRIGGFVFLPQENKVEPEDPRTADLRDQLKGLDMSIRGIETSRKAMQERIQFYQGLAEKIRESLTEEATEAAYKLARQAYKDTEQVRADSERELVQLNEEMQDLQKQRKEVQMDLNELVSDLSQRTGTLRFDVSGDLSAGVRLLVAYQVPQAGWTPVHELRADPANKSLEWVYKARMWQNTGEDWPDVGVSLNSASGLYSDGLPELGPLYLQRIEGRYAQKSVGRMAMMEVSSADMIQARPPAEAEAASTTTGFYIQLSDKVSLESGEPAIVRQALTSRLETEFWSEAVPELSTDAWLMAGMTNTIGFPILAGEMFCYIDGQLVSRQYTEGIPVGEEMEMDLGRNENIVIERKERLKKESTGGLIDKTKRHDIKYETTVTNRMPVAHRVVLQDRFPIGRDNKIQIRTESPRDVEPEEGTGLFKWERTIDSGANVVMITEYTVIYPQEWNVVPKL